MKLVPEPRMTLFAPRFPARGGFSLLEVLLAAGIVGANLLAVVCLLPVFMAVEQGGKPVPVGTLASRAVIVGTYNIRYDNPKDGESGNGWRQRVPVIASLIRFHRFDVLGIQEALHHQVEDLQSLLPAYAHTGCGRDDGRDAGEFAAIFYRKDAFTLKESGTFWLSPTPEVPSIGWDARFNRICTWVRLESNQTRGTLYAFNTHFDHHGATARRESARLVIRKIEEIAGEQPVVLVGDFNVDQTGESYRLIQDSQLLDDAYESAGERYALNGTANGFGLGTFTDRRIDHVFHTHGFKVARYGVLTDSYRTACANGEANEGGLPAFPREMKFRNFVPRVPSDHFPVLVELE